MSFIKLIGIDNSEIEFEENKNSVKEIKLQCIAKQERRIKVKVKTTDPDVFQVVGKPIVFTELNQKGVLLIKANSAKKRDNDKDKIKIEAYDYEDSVPQSASGSGEPPNIQEITLTVRVLSNKTTQQANDQKLVESQSLLDRQLDQIAESKFINQTSKFGDAQKFLSSNVKFDNIVERQKSEFLSMYQQKVKLILQTFQSRRSHNTNRNMSRKELFKLSELKNKLQRQKLKQQQIVETPKPKSLNTLHIGYAIITVILSFMIGMLAKT